MSRRPKISNSILDTIGHTPLVRLNRLPAAGAAEVLVKLESFNPMCSVKDRIGASMILAAEQAGRITPGKTTIIEPTSGNTGIGLAMAAAAKGYRLILTMPDSMSVERIRVLRALGAEVVLTPGVQEMKGAITAAEQLLKETPDSFIPMQFNNPANPAIHRSTTALEIIDRIVPVEYADAKEMTRRLASEEGILCGVSSGAICWAALKIAGEMGEGKRVVAILPDFGERYLSTDVFAFDEE